MLPEQIADCFDFGGSEEQALDAFEQARQKNQLGKIIAGLVQLAKTGTINQKVGALEALGKIPEAQEDQVVIQTLLDSLANDVTRKYSEGGFYADADDDRSPASVAANVLGRWKIHEAVKPMITIISQPHIGTLGISCLFAFAKMKATEPLPHIERLTHSDETVHQGMYDVRKIRVRDVAHSTLQSIQS